MSKTPQNATEMPPGKSTAAKTRFEFWLDRVQKKNWIADGIEQESTRYHFRPAHNGKRIFLLLTSHKEESAKLAAKIYRFLLNNGWEATLAEFYPELLKEKKEIEGQALTIGEFIDAAQKVSPAKDRTFREYAQALRRIAGAALELKRPKKGKVGGNKYARKTAKGKTRIENREASEKELASKDNRSPARREWLAMIDNSPLAELTPSKVQAWKIAYVKKAAGDPTKELSARRTANATLRQAKSLFSPKQILPHLRELALPSPLPFEGVTLFARKQLGSMRYESKIDASQLLQMAAKELPEEDPEAWKVFLLAIGAGLRRNEIDKLLWRQVNFQKSVIVIEATPYFSPKTEDSAGEVDIDRELAAILRGYFAKAQGEFVIESHREPNMNATHSTTRAHHVFKNLYEWLRGAGINEQKPLHTLRKEFGSLLCHKAGIFAASRALRHSDVSITAQYYLDKKERVTVGLGSLLKPENETSIEEGRKGA